MIFNSIEFGIFFTFVFIAYWTFFNKDTRTRNIFLILASYLFYGWWDWRFLSLIVISSLIDFYIGKKIFEEYKNSKKKRLLFVSLFVNLGFLGFFKYFNFFVDNFINSFSLLGFSIDSFYITIILPVGISFYTFQTLSYTIDIYFGKIRPTKELFSFLAFVSFFPQLVAGPIERAKNLLPQFYIIRSINYESLRSGLYLMTLGFFKKIVIADRLSLFVNAAYNDISTIDGLVTFLAIIFFAFQLYFDFSGYSDIAIGASRTLGFNLSRNFNSPYLSKSFSEFWTRWHISLSSWFRDYLYIPLGGNKTSNFMLKRNIFIVFIISGLWHGASWNFIIWGFINGAFVIFLNPLIISDINSISSKIFKPIFVSLAWALSLVFFRAQTLEDAFKIYGNLLKGNNNIIYNYNLNYIEFTFTISILILYMCFEIIKEVKPNIVSQFSKLNVLIKWPVYIFIILFIVFFGSYGVGIDDSNFIYFQF